MSWKETLAAVAPTIATALGGPLAGVAIKVAADKLGIDPDDLESAVSSADPETMISLKQAEQSFLAEMERLGVEKDRLVIEDRANARDSHKHSIMPAIICCSLTALVTGSGYCLFTLNIPVDNKEIAYLLFGTILAKWGDSIAYWVGTTRSSAEKDKRLK